MRLAIGFAACLASVCNACGGSVTGTPSAGAGGQGVGGGSGGSAAMGGSGAIAGGGGKSCARTEDVLGVKMATSASEPPPVCTGNWTDPQTWSATGIVIGSGPNVMEIDECSPEADCVPMTADILWDARDLALAVPMGAIVRVDYLVASTVYDCTEVLSIVNLPSWGGIANPVSASDELYLAAADGRYQAPDQSGLEITPVPQGCSTATGGCNAGLKPDDYALAFRVGSSETLVHMGETRALGQGLTAANLRAYVSGYCDDYWNWAYWVAKQ
jgi:hypothetical protein